MKKLLFTIICALVLGGCYSSGQKTDSDASTKRLYIEDGEYDNSEELANIQRERRGAPPVAESNYIFRVAPKDTYFYNEKSQPIHGSAELTASAGVAEASDYKAPYLTKKAVRYMGTSYSGGSVQTTTTTSSSTTSYDDEEW